MGLINWLSRHLLMEMTMLVLLWIPAAVVGRSVTVTSLMVTPYLTTYTINGSRQYDGFISDLLEEVGKRINVTFTLQTSSHAGSRSSTGSWTGIIGDVVNKKVEMAAAPLTVTSQRLRVVDFSVPFQNFGPAIVLRRPRFQQPTFVERLERIFAPLRYSAWLMSLVAYFITSVILYIICYYNPYEWRQLHRDRLATLREAESFTCMNTFWFVLSTWMWQGYIRAPRSLGGRIVVTFWWMFVVIFLLTYTASLTNLLRLGPTPIEDEQYVRILSLQDLAKQNQVQYGFVAGGTTGDFLENAQVPHLRRIWDEVRKKQNMMQMENGINKVRRSPDSAPFAFIMESAMANYMLRQEPCDLYMVGDLVLTGSYAFAYRPGWNLARQVDIALLMLQEDGTMKVLEDKWFSGPCHDNVLDPTDRDKIQVTPFYAVTLGSFSGAFVILGGGVIAGAIITVIEIIIFRKAELHSSSSEDEATQPMKERQETAKNQGGKITAQASGTENVTDV